MSLAFSNNPLLMTSRTLNNPSNKVYDFIPSLEKRYQVNIQKYWSESYNNPALLITGKKNDVKQAFSEMLEIESATRS